MKERLLSKGLVIGIIFLFIGISIAPSVTSVEFSKNKTSYSNLVKITVQLCKTEGIENQKMYITQEQDEQLNILIESFKQNLENSETYEESVEIYNDMVVSLDELGLLPESMTVKEVHKLVMGDNYKFSQIFSLKKHNFLHNIIGVLKLKNLIIRTFNNLKNFDLKSDERSNDELHKQTGGEIYENYFCLLSWDASYTCIYFIDPFFNPFSMIIQLLTRLLIGNVAYGYYHRGDGIKNPSNGWIHTEKIFKKWTYEGIFHGDIRMVGAFPLGFYALGATNFVGIHLKNLFFGHARHVRIETGNP